MIAGYTGTDIIVASPNGAGIMTIAMVAKPSRTILVVDDEPDVVKSVQDLLRLDYRVLGVTRAADGFNVMQQEEVHVVMTDQRMPEMTGVEFLHRLRGEYPEAIRLLFTGYADLRAVIDAINQGNVYRYITKPWEPEELQLVIREAIDRYDMLVERKRLTAELSKHVLALEGANKQLKESNELKTAFIRVASHELRTPLTILIGATKLAMQLPDMNAEARQWLGHIEKAEDRLQHLIDQIVQMLAANQFNRTLDRKPTNLAALLRAAADDVRPFIAIRKQQLHLDLPADLGEIAVDALKIRDTINHLLLNAIKFTGDEGNITLSARRSGSNVEIVVSDTGKGIDAEWMPRLFEPFFTGFDVSHHQSGKFEYGRQGLGLGLSVVKAFIEMHGGNIGVESTPGAGATFRVTLPL